jgi:hypothetical protein
MQDTEQMFQLHRGLYAFWMGSSTSGFERSNWSRNQMTLHALYVSKINVHLVIIRLFICSLREYHMQLLQQGTRLPLNSKSRGAPKNPIFLLAAAGASSEHMHICMLKMPPMVCARSLYQAILLAAAVCALTQADKYTRNC